MDNIRSAVRLSHARFTEVCEGISLLMVGSFAPAHAGHVAAITAAVEAVETSGERVAGIVYVPNGDSYVSFKLHDAHGTWNFERQAIALARATIHM
jgi:nicotinic acid mononucleotide adenylyltransferase